jgi:hypothetical protein
MKKLIAVSVILIMFTSTAFADVNEKLLYSFNKSFPSAQNVKWSEDASGYFASFTQSGILSKVAFTRQADLVYALRYYQEDNLPVSILLAVRKKFADKKIFSVTELSTPDNITYYINLEDAKSWYSISVTTSGSITTKSHFRKS